MSIFNKVQFPKVKSSTFDLSYDHKLSLNMGDLIPIHCQDVLPGDRFSQSCNVMLRFAPLLAPVMHKIDVYVHFFYVPNRLLWKDWEGFITGGEGTLPTPPAVPTLLLDSSRTMPGTLADYFGMPTFETGFNDYVSAFPFAAYNFIYNEFYRDQNLVSELNKDLQVGINTWVNDYYLYPQKRAWMHDYFTSALPFAQKGQDVNIPIGEVQMKEGWDTNTEFATFRNYSDGENANSGTINSSLTGPSINADDGVNPAEEVAYDPAGTLDVGSTSVRDLRRAFRLQEWLEKNARGGSRYVESLLAHFGVTSSDKRLDRPEYLGGSKNPAIISEVLQTSATEASVSPQANMAGHGISVGSGKAFNYNVEEHGWIMGIMSVMPRTAYFQGVPKQFSRNDRFDYYFPTFQNIGEQEVLNKEIYANQTTEDQEATFGYIPRYAEYKYIPSKVSGDFKTSLDYWHLGRKFANAPLLNESFIKCDPRRDIFAVTDPDVDTLYAHVFHDVKATRKMQKFGNPSF